eukprot:SAG22_NODE_6219_length_884_cov_0.956688_1_plen_194_part_01
MTMRIDNTTCCDICAASPALCATGAATPMDQVWRGGTTFEPVCPAARPKVCQIKDVYGKANLDRLTGAISACAVPPLPRDHVLWSHSRHCSNWAYVREQVQTLQVGWGAITMLIGMLFLPSVGNVADLYGRKPVFFWSSAIGSLAFLTFMFDAWLELGDFAIYLTAVMMGAAVVHGPAAWAMQMDLVRQRSAAC